MSSFSVDISLILFFNSNQPVFSKSFKCASISSSTSKLSDLSSGSDVLLIVRAFNSSMFLSFPMLRTISEMLLIYKVLSNQKQSVIDTYSKHVKWSFEYNETNEFPVEIRNKENRIDYLNFGWLDDIVEYEYAISKKYKLSDVSDLIISENLKRKGMGDTLFKIYKLCNPLSHGSNNEINETYSRKLLIDNLGVIVLDISSKIKSLTNNDFILNDVDLIKYFTECHKLNSIKLKRS